MLTPFPSSAVSTRRKNRLSTWPLLLGGGLLTSLLGAAQARVSPPLPYVRANPHSRTYELRNGQWFDGQRFQSHTYYVSQGLFQRRRPTQVDTVVDLQGQWVIPPFAEAHTHWLDGTYGLEAQIQRYLREGVYYVQVLTNSQSGAVAAKPRLNQPGSVDATYANGGLTSTLGHPFMAYEPRAMGLYDYAQWKPNMARIARSRLQEHNAYWFLDSTAAVAAQWPQILAGRPDFLKIYLLDAAHYAASHHNGQLGDKGLSPEVAADIVRRAHAAGLRVWAHIETADDFRLAVRLGVDGLGHAPDYGGKPCPDSTACYPSVADIRAAGRRVMVMTPTTWIGTNYFPPQDSLRLRAFQRAQRQLLQRALHYGLTPLVGSDWYGETPLGEALTWEKIGAFDHATLLRLWCQNTAQAIFPGRRIGRLDPGYEASLLVLGQNPLLNFSAAVHDIRWRLKQGEVIRPVAATR